MSWSPAAASTLNPPPSPASASWGPASPWAGPRQRRPHLNASGSLHQIDIAALQDAVSDNLTRETTDPWTAEIVSETGPEAKGKGA